MNSSFDGVTLPTVKSSLVELEHANEVSLSSLLKEMDDVELHFLRRCLTINGEERATVDELLQHEYFSEQFKKEFNSNF